MRNPEHTKEIILKESGKLFNTQGYKATSLSNITDATGLTKGAIYRHFDNKEVLENESLFYLSGIMFEKIRTVIKEQPTAGTKLRAVLHFFKTYITSAPIQGGCPLLNVAIEADDTNPVLRENASKILKTLKDSLVHILQRGIEHHQIRPDINKEFYATLIIASLEGAIMMSKLKRDNEDIDIVIQHLDLQIKNLEF